MSTRVYLTISDIEDMLELCKKMNVDGCTLEQNCDSGIGCTLKVELKTEMSGYHGNFVVDFTKCEEW